MPIASNSARIGTEDAILFGSCFDANGGVFEVLLDERDAVISDELNHASIIDGCRLARDHDPAVREPDDRQEQTDADLPRLAVLARPMGDRQHAVGRVFAERPFADDVLQPPRADFDAVLVADL